MYIFNMYTKMEYIQTTNYKMYVIYRLCEMEQFFVFKMNPVCSNCKSSGNCPFDLHDHILNISDVVTLVESYVSMTH